jgi:hypothetical protein
MGHENLSAGIISADSEWADGLSKALEADGWLPGVITVDELRGYLADKYLDVVILDEPSDELWAMCVAAQNASDTQSPVLAVLVPEGGTDEFRAAGADVAVPKPASYVDVGDHLRAFFG